MDQVANVKMYIKRVMRACYDYLRNAQSPRELFEQQFGSEASIDLIVPLRAGKKKLTAICSSDRIHLFEKRLWGSYAQVIECSDITDIETIRRAFDGETRLLMQEKIHQFQHDTVEALKDFESYIERAITAQRPVDAIIKELKKLQDQTSTSSAFPLHRHGKFFIG